MEFNDIKTKLKNYNTVNSVINYKKGFCEYTVVYLNGNTDLNNSINDFMNSVEFYLSKKQTLDNTKLLKFVKNIKHIKSDKTITDETKTNETNNNLNIYLKTLAKYFKQ